ncbi:OLC1v1014804C1 [Oldenlandia corymbosa var. corymbosa]|uniref:OLC1v1014804C1 n=1 Tax=Oldenlandia corymbosa var. corymbosa TaxID=529605 RepID=A0AAV1E5E0_OLDCO|nr:OLC1v1014804C1 [Oldenlandia corymbosa var. corymbosa]
MAWFSGKVSLGNFSDLAGAVKNISDTVSEGVKSIEKNFDSALGLEEKSDATSSSNEAASGLWPVATDRKALFDPVMAFMGQKGGESVAEPLETSELPKISSPEEEEIAKPDSSDVPGAERSTHVDQVEEDTSDTIVPAVVTKEAKVSVREQEDLPAAASSETSNDVSSMHVELSEKGREHIEGEGSSSHIQEEVLEGSSKENLDNSSKELPVDSSENLGSVEPESANSVDQLASPGQLDNLGVSVESTDEKNSLEEVSKEVIPIEAQDQTSDCLAEKEEPSISGSVIPEETEKTMESSQSIIPVIHHSEEAALTESGLDLPENAARTKFVEVTEKADDEINVSEQSSSPACSSTNNFDYVAELEKVKKDMKMMETALQGAARQAQAKADEIANLMNENEQLKGVIEDLRRKSNDAEVESLREEYHQRVASLERKVYALTRERDTLRREQNKKSDAAALLKEKDEIITQVMAEGEQLSKKQAAQEAQMRKLRAQIRELEEEKKGLATRLEVEENKVESIKKDKAATEKLLQETIEKHQAELTAQKDYYTNALNEAKEAEALAEARANNEARTELESRLREAEERESMLVQTLEELRQTLTRKEQQAVFREDMLQREIEDLQKRYQASERRCEELITQVPESTRPLLRQIEAIQETNARKAEAWAAVERSLNLRLQEAEGKAAGAEERERSINERLSQTLSRINVLEAQISCLRAEQTQLTKSLEKERQRAAEHRQEYLALKEEADTNEGRVKQLEEEIKDLRRKHKQEIQEAIANQELLQQELEKEKATRLDQERAARLQPSHTSEQSPAKKRNPGSDNGILTRKLSSASSLSSMEESYFLQASLDSSDNFSERRNAIEGGLSPYYIKSMTPGAFESALRQKEGELASYMSRLASMESIRDSLAEELVKLTAQCEKLRSEAALLPGLRAELDALRRRHSAALELMGERDEELEELRADIVDLKEMYREQVNLLVNKIQVMSSSVGAG